MTTGFFPPPMGWVRDDEAVKHTVEEISSAQGFDAFVSMSYGFMQGSDDDAPFYAWKAEEKLFGRKKESWNQGRVGTCFKAGTKIRMADGSYKNIEQIKLNDSVLTAEGNTGRVRHLFVRHEGSCLITFKCHGHYGLSGTSEHPILTKRGYVRLDQLIVGDSVAIPKYLPQDNKHVLTEDHRSIVTRLRKAVSHCGTRTYYGAHNFNRKPAVIQLTEVPDIIHLTEGFGRIIGLFLAEGHTDGNKLSWTFHRDEKDTLAADLVRLLKSELGATGYIQTRGRNKVCRVSLHGRIWSELFESLCGNGAGLKRLHPDLSRGPREFLEAVYKGWLAGDGHEREDFIDGVSISHELSLNMFDIANYLGHAPVIRKSDPKLSHGVKSRQRRYDVVVHKGLGKNAKGHGRNKPEQDEKYLWRKVSSVIAEPFNGDVYNIEVEGDNSYVAEGIGVHNCVSFGYGRGSNDLLLFMAAQGLIDVPEADVATEPIYALSRVEVGGGRIRGDGSVGAWAAKAVMMWGLLLRKVYWQYDLTRYSESLSRDWGNRGCPDELEPEAKKFPIKSAAICQTTEEAWRGLGSAYTLPICSNVGFNSPYQDGFCEPRGSWAHCMVIRGRTVAKKRGVNVRAYACQNSWGGYIQGDPHFTDADGNVEELPEGCFLIEERVLQGILSQKDSFLLSDAQGFAKRDPLSWFV